MFSGPLSHLQPRHLLSTVITTTSLTIAVQNAELTPQTPPVTVLPQVVAPLDVASGFVHVHTHFVLSFRTGELPGFNPLVSGAGAEGSAVDSPTGAVSAGAARAGIELAFGPVAVSFEPQPPTTRDLACEPAYQAEAELTRIS